MKRGIRILAFMLCIVLMFSTVACNLFKPNDNENDENKGEHDMNDLTALTVNANKVPLKLQYDEEAPFINEGSPHASMMAGQDIGWQNWSLPLGNGFFGANVFGRTETERVQISEKTLANPWQMVKVQNGVTSWPEVAGLNSFSETYIDFGHDSDGVSNYNRDLDIRTAIASTTYDFDGATYSREYFVSYPDKALVIRLDAENGPLSFTLRPTIPFEQSYMNTPGDGLGKSGSVTSSVEYGIGCIELSGKLEYYDVDFVGYYRVYTEGGTITADTVEHKYTDSDGRTKTDNDGVIRVDGASSAIIVATFGTDYELCTENFKNGQFSHIKQTATTNLDDAREKVQDQLYLVTDEIDSMGFEEAYSYLKSRHLADYQNLFGRVELDLDANEEDLELTTDELLNKYNSGLHSSYLESLLFQYGRYLIIASSREGSLPANLQGVWNCYNVPAWTSGYWSNINIQMNYWHVFSTNLVETFTPYVDYNAAYMEVAEKNADGVISENNPDVYGKDGGNGWTMGIAGNPFFVNSDRSCGNLGLLTQLFYDYYEYTKDEEVLKVVYDVLANAARFVTKCVKEYDGKYLVERCDSPEMYVDGVWYYTTGTTYAQTLAYMNNYGALQCAKALGIDIYTIPEEHSILATVIEQLDKYDPIHVGLSGQIKEFREEDYYGSLGNPNHRHISQLVGLFPGNIINSSTDAWMDAALVTLAGRNDGLTDWPSGTTATNEASIVAWSWAHKQAMYARAGEGDLAQEMLAGNLRNSTLENLLMVCGKIFQIEASSGTTAAFAEMLLQSDEEFIEILPAIPTNWENGAFTGLVARGNFEVSVSWENGTVNKLNLLSRNGGVASLKYPGFADVKIVNSNGKNVPYVVSDGNVITFSSTAGETYYISGFAKVERVERPVGLDFERINYSNFNLHWNEVEGADSYNVYVAYENDASYTLLGNAKGNSFVATVAEGKENVRKTFAVTAVGKNGMESKRAVCYSNPISTDLELYSISWSTADGKINVVASANENAKFARLYAKNQDSDEYTLVAESDDLTVSAAYNPSKIYALTVVSKLSGEESEKMLISNSNRAGNLLNGRDFDLTYTNGVYKAKVDLEDVYALDELRLYLNDGAADLISSLKIERLYNGEWHTAVLCESKADLAIYVCTGNDYYLSFDMAGGKASKIRIEVTATGEFLDESVLTGSIIEGESVRYENVFSGKEFVPPAETAGNIYNSSYGYQTLTDGIIYQEGSGRYSSKQKGGKVEATLDLCGVYNLSELKVYLYKDGLGKLGTGLKIQVLFGGQWTTVVDCNGTGELTKYLVKNPDGAGDWLIFNLDDVYARKVRFTIPNQTDSGWTTLYEIECLGVSSTVIDSAGDSEIDPEIPENIFANKQFVPTAEAKSQILSAGWWSGGGYEALTDGNKYGEMEGRFSTVMNNTTAMMDATLDLGSVYELDTLRFYIYDTKDDITLEKKKGSIGADMLIQVYINGVWQDVITCSDNASLCNYLVINDGYNNDYLEFDLGGVKAEKVRFYISASQVSDGITFQEIECTAR